MSLIVLEIQGNLLDTGDCMDILELESRNLTYFVYNPQSGGDLECNRAMPWVLLLLLD